MVLRFSMLCLTLFLFTGCSGLERAANTVKEYCNERQCKGCFAIGGSGRGWYARAQGSTGDYSPDKCRNGVPIGVAP